MPCMYLDTSTHSTRNINNTLDKNAKKECNSRYILCNHPISAHFINLFTQGLSNILIPMYWRGRSLAERWSLLDREYRLVVIGRKGSGKSTFINMLANLSQGKKYSDKRLIVIRQTVTLPGNRESILQCNVPEYKAISTGSTSTTQCSSYTFNGQGYVLTLIDTPGLELQKNGKEGHIRSD